MIGKCIINSGYENSLTRGKWYKLKYHNPSKTLVEYVGDDNKLHVAYVSRFIIKFLFILKIKII